MSSPTPLPPDIGKITEPLLIGYLLQWALFGVLSVQVYIYYLAFSNHDPLQRKILVYAVYVTEMIQVIIFARVAYSQFAAGFGNFDNLNTISVISWVAVPILSNTVVAVVQIFYAYRIKLIGDTYLIPSVVVLLALLQLGGGIALCVLATEMPLSSRILDKKSYIAVGISLGSSTVCDVLIAVTMTYLLSQRRSRLKQTQRLVQKVSRLIIGTGMLTAALSITNLVLFLIPSKAAYYEAVPLVLGKMYSNTMMVVLNSRMVYRIANDTELSSVVFRRSIFFTPEVGDSDEQPEGSDSNMDTTLNRPEERMRSECVATEAVPKKSTERQDSDGRISA